MLHRRAANVPRPYDREPGPPRRRSRGGRGQALVEFALVIPVFLVILAGLLYFGFMLYSKMTVINAAREGAHYGIILDPTDAAFATKIGNQVSAAAAVGLNPAQITTATAGYKVVSGVITATTCLWGVPTSNPSACKAGDAVAVSVTYPFANPIPIHLALLGNVIIDLPTAFSLNSAVQMIHE
jgi:Flp pilus assembly protein TadG